MTHTLTERTYLDRDGKVAKAGSPEAFSLLGIEGDAIDDDRAKALGLVKSKASPALDKPEPADPEPATAAPSKAKAK